jgi:C4-dicarboxylate transporter DctM subunit
MIAALLVGIVVLLFSGTSIFVALGLPSFVSLMFFSDIDPMIIVQRLFGGIDKFALMSLPFFILAANLMDRGGLSDRILKFSKALVGHIAGGAGLTTQVACMFFGALSGSAPATVMAIGKTMYPALINSKFKPSFASGLIASAGAIALIIPPSITMIIFGATTGVSVGKLFMAGLGAGIFYGIIVLTYIYLHAKKNNLHRESKASLSELKEAFINSIGALMVPVIILGGIYSGIFTPTESAAVSVVYALFMGIFVYKEIDFKELFYVMRESAVTTAQVLVLIASAQAFGWLLTVGQVPQFVTTELLVNITSPIIFFMILNVILLIMGMFMDATAAIIIMMPIVFPMALKLGIDPVHLGIVVIANLAIGQFTPPFGLNIYVTSTVSKQSMVQMMPGLMKFLIINVIALLLLTYIPQISLFLPNLF